MNLTIRNLEKRDFGGYTCSSSNALGKAEGTVRLQGTTSTYLESRLTTFDLSFRFRAPSDREVDEYREYAALRRDKTAETTQQRQTEEVQTAEEEGKR
jgi:hypothetical protein